MPYESTDSSPSSRGIRRRRLAFVAMATPLALVALMLWWWSSSSSSGEALEDVDFGEEKSFSPRDTPSRTRTNVAAKPDTSHIAVDAEIGVDAVFSAALHVPDYSTALERAGGSIALEVVDRFGQATEYDEHDWNRRAQVRVWRRLGRWWHADVGRFDSSRQGVLSTGLAGAGLEAGVFEAVVSLGSFGIGRQEVSVVRGAETRSRVTMPGRTRIVKLRFVDDVGVPIPWLPIVPRFAHGKTARPKAVRESPPSVLRSPPVDMMWSNSVSGRGGGRSSRRPRIARYRTDDGAWYVKVVTGGVGKIEARLDRRFFVTRKIDLESDFEGEEWNDYPVVLVRTDDAEERAARLADAYADDPGRRSLVGYRPERKFDREPEPPYRRRLDDLSTWPKNRGRLVVTAPPGFRPLVLLRGRSVRPMRNVFDSESGEMSSSTSRSYQLRPGMPVTVFATDGCFGIIGRREIEVRPRELGRISLDGPRQPVSLTVTTDPTVTAWARFLSIALDVSDERLGRELAPIGSVDPIPITGPTTRRQSSFAPNWKSRLGAEDALVLAFAPDSGSRWRYDRETGRPKVLDDAVVVRVPLDDDTRRALFAGDLTIDLGDALARRGEGLLTFRCIGEQGEGLPWVDGSVVAAEDDAIARSLREKSHGRRQEKRRPGHVDEMAPSSDNDPPSMEEDLVESYVSSTTPDLGEGIRRLVFSVSRRPSLDDAALRARYGDKIVDEYGAAELDRLHRFNAWYDTYRRVRSDPHGYVVATIDHVEANTLEPGKRYVLYLWSNRRDDLEPDRRIVFEATSGVTDLGVIRLPSYR